MPRPVVPEYARRAWRVLVRIRYVATPTGEKYLPQLELTLALWLAGSTILALCRDNFSRVGERMQALLQQAGVQSRTATLDIDQRGSLVHDF